MIVILGLNARTTVIDDDLGPDEGDYDCNGRKYLTTLLHTHKPIDLIIIALGANDLKDRFNRSNRDIVNGIKILIKDIYRASVSGIGPGDNKNPKIIVVGLPEIIANHKVGRIFGFGTGSDKKAKTVNILLKGIIENEEEVKRWVYIIFKSIFTFLFLVFTFPC